MHGAYECACAEGIILQIASVLHTCRIICHITVYQLLGENSKIDMHNVKNNAEAQKEELTKKIGQMVSDRISEAIERNTEAERKGFEELSRRE